MIFKKKRKKDSRSDYNLCFWTPYYHRLPCYSLKRRHKYQQKLTDRRATKFALHKAMLKIYIMHFVIVKLRCCLQKSWLKCYICVWFLKSWQMSVSELKFRCCKRWTCPARAELRLWVLCIAVGTETLQDFNHCHPNCSRLLWQPDSSQQERAHCKAPQFR